MSNALAVLDDAKNLIALAREVACGIHNLDTILQHHNLSHEQYAEIVNNPFYARTLEAAIIAWNSAGNAPGRIKIEAAATLEQWLPTLYNRLQNLDEALPGVVEGGKLLAKLAGMDAKEGAPAEGKFVINIGMGDGKQLVVEKTIELVAAEEGSANGVQPDFDRPTNEDAGTPR